MGLLISLIKSSRFKHAIKGIEVSMELAPTMVELGLDEYEGPKGGGKLV